MRKSIKKSIVLLLVAIMAFVCFCGYSDDHQKVYDEADLFESDEKLGLESYALKCGEEMKLDIVVWTSDEKISNNVEYFADSLFKKNNFGYNDCDGSGAILYINMHKREFAIKVYGAAYAMITEDELDNILDDVADYMADGKYYQAAYTYIKEVYNEAKDFVEDNEELMEEWYEGEFANGFELYDKTGPMFPALTKFKNPAVTLVIAFIIAAIVTLILYFSSKTKNTVYSKTYVKSGSLQFPVATERFLYTNTKTRKIESSGGSRGGGGGGRASRGGSRSF